MNKRNLIIVVNIVLAIVLIGMKVSQRGVSAEWESVQQIRNEQKTEYQKAEEESKNQIQAEIDEETSILKEEITTIQTEIEEVSKDESYIQAQKDINWFKEDTEKIKKENSEHAERINELKEQLKDVMKEHSSVSADYEATVFRPESYQQIGYEDIMRDRSGYIYTKHTFYGKVMQYDEYGSRAYGLIRRNDDINMLYQFEISPLPDKRLVEDDFVTVYGELKGLDTYKTVIGGSKTTPLIDVHEIYVEGIDY